LIKSGCGCDVLQPHSSSHESGRWMAVPEVS